ncbi:MAG: L-arabinose isomerase [Saprospiraceae bacterium]|nr:L-arabinose isomerase [Saprospiraceae bacterium]
MDLKKYEIWFVTGSQHLYGPETLKQVKENANQISRHLDRQKEIPVKIRFKGVLTTAEEILGLIRDVNQSEKCIGLITWMHTFSPAKMWIGGLKILSKPLLHFHTQFNERIPWNTIDMDFMNLNQTAHGGREFGFINTRLRRSRKVIVGHWQDATAIGKIADWSRVVLAWADSQTMKIARFGDNMREVAVTEGDKVSAQIQFGYSVNGYGMGDLAEHIAAIKPGEIGKLLDTYEEEYQVANILGKKGRKRKSLEEAGRIELGIRSFLEQGNFTAFTDTFENLHGLKQLPGIAVQRVMQEGYGFGAEGDWKTAALVRSMKVMAQGLSGGNSFMEDYTYHFDPGNMQVLGAHMLEICPSITSNRPSCEIHPLSIGGKADPVRLVFDADPGEALNASIVDMGNRFRLLINTVTGKSPEEKLPKLPVARVLWEAHPNLPEAATAWILAGGAHHTCYSQNIKVEQMEDFAEMAGIECVVIDRETSISRLKQDLRNNAIYYGLQDL